MRCRLKHRVAAGPTLLIRLDPNAHPGHDRAGDVDDDVVSRLETCAFGDQPGQLEDDRVDEHRPSWGAQVAGSPESALRISCSCAQTSKVRNSITVAP